MKGAPPLMLLCNSISEKRICQYRFVGVRVVEKGRVCGCTSRVFDTGDCDRPAGNRSLQVIPPGGVNFLSSQLYLSKLIGKNG